MYHRFTKIASRIYKSFVKKYAFRKRRPVCHAPVPVTERTKRPNRSKTVTASTLSAAHSGTVSRVSPPFLTISSPTCCHSSTGAVRLSGTLRSASTVDTALFSSTQTLSPSMRSATVSARPSVTGTAAQLSSGGVHAVKFAKP